VRTSTSIYLLAGILLVGCSPRTESSLHNFESATVDGVSTVTNSGGPKYTEPLFSYVEVLRLKEDPANEASLLYRPRQFIQDEQGRFYVEDYGNSRIAVFDREGIFLHGIGRSGDGPGEFQAVRAIDARDAVLQVFDYRSIRLSRFETGGALIDVTSLNRLASDQGLNNLMRAFLTADDRVILISQQMEMDSEFVWSWHKLIVLGPDREVAWELEAPQHKSQTFGMYRGRPALGVLIPFASRSSIDFDPVHGVLYSPGDEPTLLLHNVYGSLELRIRFEIERNPITAEDQAGVLDSFDERIANASGALAEQLKAMKEGTIFPDRWPYWSGASLDDNGYIWLGTSEREADREAAGGGFLSMVLSPEGEYLGNTRRPLGRWFTTSHGRVLILVTDEETDAEHLIVYHIPSAIDGFTYP
jgi:hypothetical protein